MNIVALEDVDNMLMVMMMMTTTMIMMRGGACQMNIVCFCES